MVHYPNSFLLGSYSGAYGIATTFGEIVGLHIAILSRSGIAVPYIQRLDHEFGVWLFRQRPIRYPTPTKI
jgi:hypothetical protein